MKYLASLLINNTHSLDDFVNADAEVSNTDWNVLAHTNHFYIGSMILWRH